ncbi:MAG TPA: tetratricopeptide repeat protein [bacterium]|nr:tetratricopeptide repeat protein [bacterium]
MSSRLFKIAAMCLLILAARAPAFAYSGDFDALVFDFDVESDFPEKWAAPALTDYAIRAISLNSKERAMPRDALKRLASRWAAAGRREMAFETRDALRQHTGASFIVDGSLSRDRSGFQFTGSVINPDTGLVRDISFSLKEFDIEAARGALRGTLETALGRKLPNDKSALLGTTNSSASAAHWKGVWQYERNETEKAIAFFQQSMSADPAFIEPALSLARAQMDKALFSDAAAILRKAISSAPKEPRAHFLLGLSLHFQRQKQLSLESLGTAANLEPRNPEYLFQLGVVHKESFRYPEAISNFEKALAIDKSYDAWFPLAEIYATTKQEQKAIHSLEQAAVWSRAGLLNRLKNDADFNWLRTNARFQLLIKQLERQP